MEIGNCCFLLVKKSDNLNEANLDDGGLAYEPIGHSFRGSTDNERDYRRSIQSIRNLEKKNVRRKLEMRNMQQDMIGCMKEMDKLLKCLNETNKEKQV